jgi:hypothetical protein
MLVTCTVGPGSPSAEALALLSQLAAGTQVRLSKVT